MIFFFDDGKKEKRARTEDVDFIYSCVSPSLCSFFDGIKILPTFLRKFWRDEGTLVVVEVYGEVDRKTFNEKNSYSTLS